jgi:hypothetical protein
MMKLNHPATFFPCYERVEGAWRIGWLMGWSDWVEGFAAISQIGHLDTAQSNESIPQQLRSRKDLLRLSPHTASKVALPLSPLFPLF